MITIDESALQARAKDQSLIKSLFHFHSLTEVQANPDYLLLRIRKNRDNPYPMYSFPHPVPTSSPALRATAIPISTRWPAK
jgi:hypothetical protein